MDTTSTPIRAAIPRAEQADTPASDAAGAPNDAPKPEVYAPVEHFFLNHRGLAAARASRSGRVSIGVIRDPQFLLAVAIALPVLAVEGSYELALPWLAVAVPIAFVSLQLALTSWRSAPDWLAAVRLAISLAFIVVANAWLDPTGTWPLSALAVPVVALAASRGDTPSVGVALAGMLTILVPLAVPNADPGSRQQTLALAMAAGVVAFGCQRVVANLRRSTVRVHQANVRERRHARQLSAVESVGSLLAREGPRPDTLDRVMGLLEDTFGYRYPSVYVWDGHALQLGARGVVLKESATALLLKAIRIVMDGGYWVGRESVADLVVALGSLIQQPHSNEPLPAFQLMLRSLIPRQGCRSPIIKFPAIASIPSPLKLWRYSLFPRFRERL